MLVRRRRGHFFFAAAPALAPWSAETIEGLRYPAMGGAPGVPHSQKYRCSRKKHALEKFDAKAFFSGPEHCIPRSFVEESEFEVKYGPTRPTKQKF